jgi:radical SAM superfamily enzyme YgiQ (UPF0313 family)
MNAARRLLCVFPRYADSFGTFNHAFPLVGAQAFMPPQGLLVLAAYVPDDWDVRFIDENITPVADDDLYWADVLLLSGMHVQRDEILRLANRAARSGTLTVLGGPSVSGCPEWYPDVDILHVGELGDATDDLIERLRVDVTRPSAQEVYMTRERLPMADFPPPRYELIDLRRYFIASVQYSSGCPFRCEFCDIPELYGHKPRLKTPEQITAELDAMLRRGNPGSVYFVDDNFIGNPRAATTLLEELVRWQQRNGFPVRFACEATLNIAAMPHVLELMRRAYFTTIFCGIESPDEDALRAMKKSQNLRNPILDAVRTLNSYGLEVASGIILGLDTDTPETYAQVSDFVDASNIPLLTINILEALPRTPLWRRLEAAGRLKTTSGRSSNVDFLLPDNTVEDGWRRCISRAYDPAAIYRRYRHQIDATFPNRIRVPVSRARLNLTMIRHGGNTAARVLWHVGVKSDYRREFWRTVAPAFRRGGIDRGLESLLQVAVVSHHLISFTRQALAGNGETAFYAPPSVVGRQQEEFVPVSFGRGSEQVMHSLGAAAPARANT